MASTTRKRRPRKPRAAQENLGGNEQSTDQRFAGTLNGLDPFSFQHMVNALALRVLGPGLTTLGPGPDGGRDACLEGRAPYPTTADCWSGLWYGNDHVRGRGHDRAEQNRWSLHEPWISRGLSISGPPSSRSSIRYSRRSS